MFDPRMMGISKFGFNNDVDGAEDIWSVGGDYPYPSSAETLYVSSSDAADTMQVRVTGLDANGVESTLDVVLAGQGGVVLSTALLRVYRAKILGSSAPDGDIYIGTETSPTVGVPAAANIRAKIDNGQNQTQMALTTIPAVVDGRTIKRAWVGGAMLSILPGSPSGVQAQVTLYVRSIGGLFLAKSAPVNITEAQSIITIPFIRALEVEPLSDVKLRVDNVSAANTKVSGEFAVFYEV